jgi:hypothetical protein
MNSYVVTGSDGASISRVMTGKYSDTSDIAKFAKQFIDTRCIYGIDDPDSVPHKACQLIASET